MVSACASVNLFVIPSRHSSDIFHTAYNSVPLKAGMTVTNEPGYYEDGKFGIRIENVMLVREVKTPNNFGEKGYLGFEHVTM
jgi:Xaa-Pro aminopeptidase